MKNAYKKVIAIAAAAAAIQVAAHAQEDQSAEDMDAFAATIYEVRDDVDSIIQQAEGGFFDGNEDDNQVGPLLSSASSSMTSAGNSATSAAQNLHQAKTAPPALAANLREQAKFKIVDACVETGWAALDLGSAALSALDPPLGSYTPFHSKITTSWSKLNTARSKAKCP